jgi:hypothetical protein
MRIGKFFNSKFIVLSFILFIIFINNVNASTYYSIATGDWTSSSSWSLSSGGTPISSSYPGIGDDVIIEGGYTIFINNNNNLSAANITIGTISSGTLLYNGNTSATLNVSGNITIGGSTPSISGALDVVFGGWFLEITCGKLLKGIGPANRAMAQDQNFTFTNSFTLDASFNQFRNFRVNGGIVKLSDNTITNGSDSPWIFAGSTLDLGSYTMTDVGPFKYFKLYGTLIVGGINNFPSNYGNIVIDPNSTVIYNYNGNKYIHPVAYGKLVIAGTGSYQADGFISAASITSFINAGPITLCQNGSYYLAPSTTNGTFSSSDPTIATVNSSGYVTAVSGFGTTDISLTTVDGTVSATVTVAATST